MTEILPDLEAYGPDARHSAVADLLELEALEKGKSMPIGTLEDHLSDAGWVEPLAQLRFDSGQESKDDLRSDAREQAQKVFDCLLERANILGEGYPFQLSGARLSAKEDAKNSLYVALLCLTVDHAYRPNKGQAGIPKPKPNPEVVFEEVVHEFLRSVGWLSFLSGASRGKFRELAKACSDHLRLPLALDDAHWSRWANEAGVDVMSRLPFGNDQRYGTWVFLGQVTVAQTSAWEKKARDPKTGTWTKLFQGSAQCIPFLAIPHHASPEKMRSIWDLCHQAPILVLDRLRLCSRDFLQPPDLVAIRDRVLSLPVRF